jgi:hypothetical protein
MHRSSSAHGFFKKNEAHRLGWAALDRVWLALAQFIRNPVSEDDEKRRNVSKASKKGLKNPQNL